MTKYFTLQKNIQKILISNICFKLFPGGEGGHTDDKIFSTSGGTESESQEEFLPVPLKVEKVRKLKNQIFIQNSKYSQGVTERESK